MVLWEGGLWGLWTVGSCSDRFSYDFSGYGGSGYMLHRIEDFCTHDICFNNLRPSLMS